MNNARIKKTIIPIVIAFFTLLVKLNIINNTAPIAPVAIE
ncbi:hypothetical protein DFR84_002636 [Clostridium beijerinckii]|nr:hypothetical protein [Clostridium beijerinckii]